MSTRALVLCLAAALAGCASNYSLGPTHDDSIRTVSVPIWQNNTFSTDLEIALTEAIVKEIQASTPWRVTSREAAQTELRGVITETRLHKLSTQRGAGLSQETAVQVTVDFAWTDTRTGQVLVEREAFSAAESFVPSYPVQESLELGEFAVVQELARDIVRELRSNW